MIRVRTPLLTLIAAIAQAQQVVAPTAAQVGRPRGEDTHGYNIVNSFETGYRFSTTGGNFGKYRSDVNYGNGIRLLGSSLTVHSKEGQGRWFDEIVLSTQGLGNDPYQSSVLRVQKNRLYRYDMLWRLNEYFNPALAIGEGRHLADTRRRLQDHEFTLLPQSSFRFHAGFTRNSQDGPALSTVQLFDGRGDEFSLFSDVRRLYNEFRLGGDFEVAGLKVSLLRAWHNFKEDTRHALAGPRAGANPDDLTTLQGLGRAEPYHGNTPLWRGTLHRETRSWAVAGRATYSGGRRSFALDEIAVGTSPFGAAANRQLIVAGNARRPVTTGDFSLSLFPTPKLTVVNNAALHSTRIDGDSTFAEINNATRSGDLILFRYLGLRAVSNFTDVNYRPAKWLGFYAGYHYSTRRIRSIETFRAPPFEPDGVAARQENAVHSGLAGLRLRPVKPLTINLDAEVARADRPFTPVSERNFHGLGGRVQYKSKSLLLSAAYRQSYNTNSVALSAHSSRGRNYTADASWAPRDWFAFDASYARLHLDTASGVAFFTLGRLTTGQSVYISNLHMGNLGVRMAPAKRVDGYLGYSVSRDDGRSFPLRFESPLARVSVRLHQRLRWNAGWQYYRYVEDVPLVAPTQNYRAHTGYSSLLWSF